MSSQLLVHQPYRTLLSLRSELPLNDEDVSLTRSIINDTFMTDLPITYSPHTICLVAILLALVLRPSQGSSSQATGSGAAAGLAAVQATLSQVQGRGALPSTPPTTTTEGVSTPDGNSFSPIRRDETTRLIRKLAEDSAKNFSEVELTSRFFDMTFNNIMRMISGKRYYGEDCDMTELQEASEFRDMVTELLQLSGANNKADFMPILRLVDFEGLEKRVKGISSKTDRFLRGLLQEHRDKKQRTANTMIDHLLTLQESQPEYYTDQIIKGLALAMLLAGTDSSAVTLEWSMCNVLNYPEVLEKIKAELDTHVGQDRLVDESDIPKLTYLKNVINETLRLYTPAPLLLPHSASDDCTIGGYKVPRDTIVLINAWALHRDPQLWTEATTFKPERFDKKGELEKLIPFGLGRRACPGELLAIRAISMTLALLIQCFDWKRVSDEEIDMGERDGFVLMKSIPVKAMCKSRPVINNVFK